MSKTTEPRLEIGDLVKWIDPLFDLFDEPQDSLMTVYGIVIGFNKDHPKVFWFDKIDMNSYFMESDQIVLISRANSKSKL